MIESQPGLEKKADDTPSPTLTVITPAFNEESNLPVMFERLKAAFANANIAFEWIIVDDHSRDATFATCKALAASDCRVRAVRLSRNAGSHNAILCGLQHSRGECAVVMAADLQDPPEVVCPMVERWRQGDQVVWAVRTARLGETQSRLAFSNLYYWIMRNMVGLHDMPATGADFFLADRRVIDALAQFQEVNVSLFALLTWMGFRQTRVEYDKQARLHGRSGWSLRKKIKLVVDSVTAFSFFPIRAMTVVGLIAAGLGFLYSAVVIVNAYVGRPVEGWTSLMVVVLVLCGTQMLMVGVLGEYLWRTLSESRHRPRYLIEDCTPGWDPTGKTANRNP